ncbi:MAG: YkgJ family cysteine cluster protein [Desulfobacterales bacterium]
MIKNRLPKEKQGLTVLTPENSFRFKCHEGLDCFTRCCRNISIVLTPYDILRMKNALNTGSGEFLANYTMSMIGDAGLPVVLLKMKDDDEKNCPFVTRKGCRIYPDRPWSCRIYPLQPESSKITERAAKQYYSVMDVPFCLGLEENSSLVLAEWIEEQGVSVYQKMEAPFKTITTNAFLSQNKITNKNIQEMFYMAGYDLDRFKRFVLESTFLERFEVAPEIVGKIKEDDIELYFFAMRWLEYGLLGQHVLKVKPEVTR